MGEPVDSNGVHPKSDDDDVIESTSICASPTPTIPEETYFNDSTSGGQRHRKCFVRLIKLNIPVVFAKEESKYASEKTNGDSECVVVEDCEGSIASTSHSLKRKRLSVTESISSPDSPREVSIEGYYICDLCKKEVLDGESSSSGERICLQCKCRNWQPCVCVDTVAAHDFARKQMKRCQLKLSRVKTIKVHQQKNVRFTCVICSKTVESRLDFAMHIGLECLKAEMEDLVEKMKDASGKYVCSECSQGSFANSAELILHLTSKHDAAQNLYSEKIYPGRVFKCVLCAATDEPLDYNSEDGLRRHLVADHLHAIIEEQLENELNGQKGASGEPEESLEFSSSSFPACPVCNQKSSDFWELAKHNTLEHPEMLDEILDCFKIIKTLTAQEKVVKLENRSSSDDEDSHSSKIVPVVSFFDADFETGARMLLRDPAIGTGVSLSRIDGGSAHVDEPARCLMCSFECHDPSELTRRRTLAVHYYERHFKTELDAEVSSGTCPKCAQPFGADKLRPLAIHNVLRHKAAERHVEMWRARNPDAGRRASFAVERLLSPEEWRARYLALGLPLEGVVVQQHPCHELGPKLAHCYECIKVTRGKGREKHVCQFQGFRKISFDASLIAFTATGFLDPEEDPTEHDRALWDPLAPIPLLDTIKLDEVNARFILTHVGHRFCDMVRQEQNIARHYQKPIVWKRMLEKMREMCDVCHTTLFNLHWTCPQCAVLVCIDCFDVRKRGGAAYKSADSARAFKSVRRKKAKAVDSHSWPLCHDRAEHDVQRLALTQIICRDFLTSMRDLEHEVRAVQGLDFDCGCQREKFLKEKISAVVKVEPESVAEDDANRNPLRKFRLCRSGLKRQLTEALGEDAAVAEAPSGAADEEAQLHMARLREVWTSHGEGRQQQPNPAEAMSTWGVSAKTYPDAEHKWLCDGRLLLLLEPRDDNNMHIFQELWKLGHPVVIANSSKHLNANLWTPESFERDFGHQRHSLVNCLDGSTVENALLSDFWRGFEEVGKRLKSPSGNNPMLLKLKDWPPTDDIADFMPSRFDDLVNSFSMPQYTLRDGILNLAAYLPEFFLRPELGPKLYIAYGSALYPDKGSTNLHIDMSDAVNCLVYVGINKDTNKEDNMKLVEDQINQAGCDILMRQRAHDEGVSAGALWHIFHPCDTVKIRDMLKSIAVEKGKRLNPHDDPIHDQSTYLDDDLRLRLYKEYGVRGYAIVQCTGDTVFIPAGAAHQVRNLHNCIKVAEDFVSPENTSHCLHLTQEFRHLTEWHTNHEDKLQIKNIIYHSVRAATAVLAKERLVPKSEVMEI